MKKYIFAIALLLGLSLAGVTFLNYWRNEFWEAVESKHFDHFLYLIGQFGAIATVLVFINAYQGYFQQSLSLAWRTRITHQLMSKYKYTDSLENIEQRMSDDVRDYTDETVNLVTEFSEAILTMISFTVILATIQPWLVGVSFTYAALGTIVTFLLGRKLVALSYENQAKEAYYRKHLASSEDEGVHLNRYKIIKHNVRTLIKKTKTVTLFTSSFTQLEVILPYLFLIPAYFYGDMKFGQLMQVASAMGTIQVSLAIVVRQYPRIARFQSVRRRLTELKEALNA